MAPHQGHLAVHGRHAGEQDGLPEPQPPQHGPQLYAFTEARAVAAADSAIAACGRVEFAGVCDPIAEKGEAARERYGARQSFTDYEAMIREVAPDIVCIATRPSPHAPVSIFAAENGVRGIYCEKPLCNSMAEADAMLEALESHGVKFNYGTNRRYSPLFRRMRALMDAGEISQQTAQRFVSDSSYLSS